jgi:hypothetical protein
MCARSVVILSLFLNNGVDIIFCANLGGGLATMPEEINCSINTALSEFVGLIVAVE